MQASGYHKDEVIKISGFVSTTDKSETFETGALENGDGS